MDKIEVDLDWLLQVRDLLYKISLQDADNGVTAEILGSYFPDYIPKD